MDTGRGDLGDEAHFRAQKGVVGAPAYSRYVNRRSGWILALSAFRLGWTPNGLTRLSAAATAAGLVLIASGSRALWVAVSIALLLAFGYALDSADGQLARLANLSTLSGEWFDHVVDMGKIAGLHTAVLVGAWRTGTPQWFLGIALAFLVTHVVLFFAMILKDLLIGSRTPVIDSTVIGSSQSMVRSFLVVGSDFGLLCWIFLLWGQPELFAVAYAALALFHILHALVALPMWMARLRTLDSEGALL